MNLILRSSQPPQQAAERCRLVAWLEQTFFSHRKIGRPLALLLRSKFPAKPTTVYEEYKIVFPFAASCEIYLDCPLLPPSPSSLCALGFDSVRLLVAQAGTHVLGQLRCCRRRRRLRCTISAGDLLCRKIITHVFHLAHGSLPVGVTTTIRD